MRTPKAILALATVGALVTLGLTVDSAPAAPVSANPCTAITPRALDDYARLIGTAHRFASTDASKFGSSGKYAVAATNSRDQLKRAQDRAEAAARDLRASNPSVTTPAEAGTVKEHVRFILELVPQAAHWAIISEIYHDSPDARKAFDESVKVLEQGNVLYAESGRCYMEL